MWEVVKKEVLKLLKARVVPKKGGMIVICNEKKELIPLRTVTSW
jgi:hypothetical protein